MADMKIQGEVTLDTTKADAGFAKVEQTAGRMSAAVKKSADDASKSVDNIGSGSAASATKLDRSTKSMISSIQRVTAQMDAGEKSSSKYFETLANQRGVNVDALRPYLAQLDAAKAKQDAAALSLGNVGMSAKATAAALRGVPAQFTDIFVSLASGQQPMTVLLQQGGQLKDMFGGVGNAASALAGYVKGLINPFTVTAGALGAVAVAAYKGAAEFQEYNKTLILTGELAGVTAGQLASMAEGLDDASYSITQAQAAKAIDEIVKAGVRGEDQIKRFAKAAADFEDAGGGAAKEVAKAFSDLAKEPLQASLKLTEQMGYLTEATYKQIKALDDQGDSFGAAKVAQEAYYDAITSRTPKLVDNLGFLEQAWKGVSNTASEAWDSMLGIGRASTLDQKIAEAEKRLSDLDRRGFVVGDDSARGEAQSALRKEIFALRTQAAQEKLSAQYKSDAAQKEKERISFLSQGEKYISAEQKQHKEILAVQNLVTRQIITQEEAEKRIAAIRASGAKSSANGSSRSTATRDEFGELYNRITAKDAGIDASFYKDLNTLYEGYQKGRVGIDEYRTAVENLVQAQSFAKEINKENAQALETEAKFVALVAEKETKWAAELDKRNQSAQSIIDNIRLETSMLGQNDQQRQESIYLRELERLGVEKGTVAYEEYAAAIKSALADQQAQRETIAFWEDLEYTAENVFMDIAMNGEEAFKRIGDSIKEYVLKMLYEITVKRWIIQLSGGNLGTSTSSLLDAGSSLYSAYSTGAAGGAGAGAGAVGGSASAVGSFASGSMSAANTYGSIYANTTGTGINGLLATNGAYGTAGAGGTAGSTTASAVGYLGYAALIAAAVMIANNLYEKGYTRAALGDGDAVTNRAYNSTFTTDANMGDSRIYNESTERINRSFLDALGVSEKWSDIFSGTTRMSALFGRKLKGYGFDIGIDGGEADVTGYQYYKGGVFRSNKTVQTDIDSRDAEFVKQQIDGVQASTRAMAQAMGYSTEAIDNYTGSLKVNFKGAETAEEQSKRMAEAMDDLGLSMLKAASGGALTKEKFEEFIAGIQESMAEVGVTSEGIADVILAGMTGRLSEADVGAQLSEIVIGGIYDSIAGSYASQIANVFTSQILTPMFTAIASGVPISQAISQQAIENVVATAKNAAVQLNAILTDPGFQSAINGIQQAISGIAAATGSVSTPSFRRVTTGYNAAAEAARAAAEAAARAAQQIKDAWQDVSDAITDEIKRIRGEILGDSEEGRAYYEAQFAIATAAARAGDQDAAAKLPELSQALLDIADATAGSLGDLRAVQAATLASLSDTRQILADQYGLEIPQFASGGYHTGGLRIVGENGPELEATGPAKYYTADQTASMLGGGNNSELIAEVRALREQVKDLTNISQATAINTKSLDDVTKKVTNHGNATRTIAA